MKKICSCAVPDFASFVNNDCLYVDKTKYLYELVCGKFSNFLYFLCRPAGFGKTLFSSALDYLLRGRKTLFKGLYISEETDYTFDSFPVLHFNFSAIEIPSYEAFYSSFQSHIKSVAAGYGVHLQISAPSMMLEDLIAAFSENVVIIIDDYDVPYIKCLCKKDFTLLGKIQRVIGSFLSMVKACSSCIRLFFMTGELKYTCTSIFSQLNNLIDISFDRNFASAFGYTEAELRLYFSEYINEYLCRENREYETEEDFINAVRDNYDGYCFSTDMAQRVYNPVSVASFFLTGFEFKNYWNSTGVSSLAVEFARRNNLLSIIDSRISLNEETFTSFEISQFAKGNVLNDSQIYALLYFTGYLTIRGVNRNIYELEFPNKEVARSFSYSLVTKYCEDGFDPVHSYTDSIFCKVEKAGK